MRSTTLIHRAMNFLIAIFFILSGLVAFIIPWVAYLRRGAIDALLENAWSMTVIGLGFFVVGILMLATAAGKRRDYYHVRSGDRSILVDNTLIKGYLVEYWQKAFPGEEVSCDVKVKGNKIHVIADLPYLPFEEQRPFLQKVEGDIAEIFGSVLDSPRSFSLSVSFQESSSQFSHN